MDEDTAELSLSLQLQDLEALVGGIEDPKAPSIKSDGNTALVAYRDEVAAKLNVLRDGRMGRSFARAVQQDGSALRAARLQENFQILDRENTFRMEGIRGPNLPAPITDLTDETEDVVIGRLAILNTISPKIIDFTPISQLSVPNHLHEIHRVNNEDVIGVMKTCASCQEPVAYFNAVYGPCGHDYCKDCIKQLFLMATRDESLFPPRCCRKAIPMAAASVFFTEDFVRHFKAKALEFTTPNRTYCASITCAAFIPPGNINNEIGVCTACAFWTCVYCKNHSHRSRDCPKDVASQELISAAQAAGWQHVIAVPNSAISALALGSRAIVAVCFGTKNALLQRANLVADRNPAPDLAQAREVMTGYVSDTVDNVIIAREFFHIFCFSATLVERMLVQTVALTDCNCILPRNT
ncbi:hypothetical protein MMC27_001161 [Xylographa pallens]|nr:hypothetical protein [Xylographa pallens]